jgi:hypothetical protein
VLFGLTTAAIYAAAASSRRPTLDALRSMLLTARSRRAAGQRAALSRRPRSPDARQASVVENFADHSIVVGQPAEAAFSQMLTAKTPHSRPQPVPGWPA